MIFFDNTSYLRLRDSKKSLGKCANIQKTPLENVLNIEKVAWKMCSCHFRHMYGGLSWCDFEFYFLHDWAIHCVGSMNFYVNFYSNHHILIGNEGFGSELIHRITFLKIDVCTYAVEIR